MSDRLKQQLKEFEKELSLLLVRFMKIADDVAQQKAAARPPARAGPRGPAKTARATPPLPPAPAPTPPNLVAYV